MKKRWQPILSAMTLRLCHVILYNEKLFLKLMTGGKWMHLTVRLFQFQNKSINEWCYGSTTAMYIYSWVFFKLYFTTLWDAIMSCVKQNNPSDYKEESLFFINLLKILNLFWISRLRLLTWVTTISIFSKRSSFVIVASSKIVQRIGFIFTEITTFFKSKTVSQRCSIQKRRTRNLFRIYSSENCR